MTSILKRLPAKAVVEAYLASTLPPGTPRCYRVIIGARFIGSGRKRVAHAQVEMFDGQPAAIEVFEWGHGGQGHRWTAMSGGDAFFEDGRWQRVSEAA